MRDSAADFCIQCDKAAVSWTNGGYRRMKKVELGVQYGVMVGLPYVSASAAGWMDGQGLGLGLGFWDHDQIGSDQRESV